MRLLRDSVSALPEKLTGYFRNYPGIVTYGKIIGAGMPVGLTAERKRDYGNEWRRQARYIRQGLWRKPHCYGQDLSS